MPMFDVETADKIRFRDVETDAETMLKAKFVGTLDAERCSAGGTTTVLVPPSMWTLFKKFCVAKVVEISVGVIIVLIGAVIVAIYSPRLIAYFS